MRTIDPASAARVPTVPVWARVVEVVMDGVLRYDETYASVTFVTVGCGASAVIP